ncbi:hypothetical protein BSKO_02369 [Bryopsis sp. KO-2023]|nr:hypothetical protein BSKO_02369 [Bryopsis sp. KO-2023]
MLAPPVGSLTRGHWHRWGPFWLLLASVPLTAADLMRHIIIDGGFMIGRFLLTYVQDCEDESGFSGFSCLSNVAVLFMLFSYLGFGCMIVGLFWGLGIVGKVKKAYGQIRNAQKPPETV